MPFMGLHLWRKSHQTEPPRPSPIFIEDVTWQAPQFVYIAPHLYSWASRRYFVADVTAAIFSSPCTPLPDQALQDMAAAAIRRPQHHTRYTLHKYGTSTFCKEDQLLAFARPSSSFVWARVNLSYHDEDKEDVMIRILGSSGFAGVGKWTQDGCLFKWEVVPDLFWERRALHKYGPEGEKIVAMTFMRLYTPRILVFNKEEVDEAAVVMSAWRMDMGSRSTGKQHASVQVESKDLLYY